MKLYATVTSERASKGQGGNEYLDIDITVGDAKQPYKLASLTVRRADDLDDSGNKLDDSGYILVDENDDRIRWVSDRDIKGEQQKGD